MRLVVIILSQTNRNLCASSLKNYLQECLDYYVPWRCVLYKTHYYYYEILYLTPCHHLQAIRISNSFG